MKNSNYLTIVGFAALLILSSCGGSKKVQTVDPYNDNSANTTTRVKVEKEECAEEAIKSTEFLRGYGIGASADQMFARDIASTNARNEILNSIQVLQQNALTRYNEQYTISRGEEMTMEDQGKIQAMVKTVAEETLTGARIICSNTYMVGKKYEVHVCIELTGVDLAAKAYDKISADEKLNIDYGKEKYKEEMDADLEILRQQKAGN